MPPLWSSPDLSFDHASESGSSWGSPETSRSESEQPGYMSPISSWSSSPHPSPKRTPNTKHVQSISPDLPQRPLESTSKLRQSLRLAHKSLSFAVGTMQVPQAANIAPPEILLQIFHMLGPRDFDNARRTCSQWMRVSLDRELLESMLKRAGWWDAWEGDCQTQRPLRSVDEQQSLVWRMSRRFATECILSGRKTNVEKTGFLTTSLLDFSRLSREHSSPRPSGPQPYSQSGAIKRAESTTTPRFNVSNCENYLLVTSGRMIYVYHLLMRKPEHSTTFDDRKDMDIAPMGCISCPAEVLSVTIDTSRPRFVVAALLRNRVGMICDLVPSDKGSLYQMHLFDPNSRHYYINVCLTEDPPLSVSICSGRRCVAFGCGSGIELHWFDEKMKQNCRKFFPMSQPSEVLHFLPSRPDTPVELRLISSLAGPGMPGCRCHKSSYGDRQACQFHLLSGVRSLTQCPPRDHGNLSLLRATHCHHYRAVPINDGLHILFIEPRTGLLCIGSDTPIGGPISLTRALVCIPPSTNGSFDGSQQLPVPTVFTVGSDLNWGLRIVAAYQDRIVLYSVPLDVFNMIRREREKQGDGVMGDSDLARDWFLDGETLRKRSESLVQNQNGDWEFLFSVSYRPTAMMWPFKIYGKETGRMENVVELALQSSFGGTRVWAFSASGQANIIDLDTFTSKTTRAVDVPCQKVTVDADGSIASTRLTNRTEHNLFSPQPTRKRKRSDSPEIFGGKHTTARQLRDAMFDRVEPSAFKTSPQLGSATAQRRSSFAACIMDFKIPELGAREGGWVDQNA